MKKFANDILEQWGVHHIEAVQGYENKKSSNGEVLQSIFNIVIQWKK